MAAMAVILVGCEELTDSDVFKQAGVPTGGSVIGTWEVEECSVKAPGAPTWTAVTVGKDAIEARGLFGRIAFYSDGTCRGELMKGAWIQNFDGTWTATGGNLEVTSATEIIAGTYGASGGRLVFSTTRVEEDISYEVTLTLTPGPDLPKPPEPDAFAASSDGGDSRDEGDESPVSGEGSQQFLWKPVSHNDGKAAVLFPAKYRWEQPDAEYEIERVYINGGDKDGEEPHVIYWPEGRNGNRIHARFHDKGEEFGEDFEVVIELTNGDEVSWEIEDGEDRTSH